MPVPCKPVETHGVSVRGAVDLETRCRHWRGQRDIIAIRFCCCDGWYPCYECHAALADHPASVWPVSALDKRAVLCGACGAQLTIAQYVESGAACLECAAAFNPGCKNHYHLYFELPNNQEVIR